MSSYDHLMQFAIGCAVCGIASILIGDFVIPRIKKHD